MINVTLSAEDIRKLFIWEYVDIGEIRVTITAAGENKACELIDNVRQRVHKRNRLGANNG